MGDTHAQNDRTGSSNLSAELDELTSTLIGDALDLLAEGGNLGVLLVIEDAKGRISSFQLSDDGAEALIEGARAKIRSTRAAMRYAFAYEAGVEVDDSGYADALVVEFGEKGAPSFSAYSLIAGKGLGDDFSWTEPAPAGEEEPLLG